MSQHQFFDIITEILVELGTGDQFPILIENCKCAFEPYEM